MYINNPILLFKVQTDILPLLAYFALVGRAMMYYHLVLESAIVLHAANIMVKILL